MPVAPSFDDLIDQYIAAAQAQRASLQFNDGDVTEAEAHGSGAMADVVLRYAVQAFKETFVDGARGDALTALVDDRYNIQRFPATPAQVTVQFARTSGGAAGVIPQGTVVATDIGADGGEIRFATDTPQVVLNASNGPWIVVATATARGAAGNVAPATVTRIVDPLFDRFTVTNTFRAGGGNEEEQDPALRVRARMFWLTIRRGTIAAIEYGARLVASVRVAKAIEDPNTGITTLVVSDEDGNSTASMVADVELEVENWRAAGSLIQVTGGVPLIVNVIGTLDVDEGVDPLVVGPLAEEAIRARIRKQRQGEILHLDSIKSAGIAVDPDGINAINLTSPLATVVPNPTQLIRPGTVSIT